MPLRGYIHITIAALLCGGYHAAASSADWEELPSLPVGLAGAAIFQNAGTLEVAGGTTWTGRQKQWLDVVWQSDKTVRSWDAVTKLPRALAYAGFVESSGERWILGGHNEAGSRREILLLDDSGGGEVVARLPRPWRFAHGAVLNNRSYFVVREEAGGSRWQGAFLQVDLTSGETIVHPDLPNRAWVLPGVAPIGGRILVAGGAAFDEGTGEFTNQSSLMAFDPAAGVWERVGDLPLPVRGLAAVSLGGDHAYLAGGFSDAAGFLEAGFVFDLSTGALTPSRPLPISAMPVLIRVGGWVYFLGGEDAPRSRSARVFRIAIANLADPEVIAPVHQ